MDAHPAANDESCEGTRVDLRGVSSPDSTIRCDTLRQLEAGIFSGVGSIVYK
jgi:hypothetical protein